MSRPIKNVLIVGGGTAGWMTAAALARTLDLSQINVSLVESDAIGTVGVGEATIPDIIDFNRMLGFDEATILRETSGTIKYGIEFLGWTREGEKYFHPFGTHGVTMDGLSFHQHWARARAAGRASDIEDYCLTAQAAKHGRAAAPSGDPNSPLSMLAHAYQFDAGLYAQFLRRFAEGKGLKRVEGRVTNVGTDPESGFIKSVSLEDGQQLNADLFLDCSGFRALLLGETLGVKHESWADLLPVDTAVTVQTEKMRNADPFTTVTAREAGWQWHIPLQHRTGNGYVYCSKFKTDDVAKETLLANVTGKHLTEPRHIRFTTGRREKFWEKNCIGIGLCSGFLEPLESTSIYLIQAGVKALISLFPDASCPEVEQREYNNIMSREFEQIRDFLVLHYVANQREGEPFWDYLRDMPIPDSLQQKMDLFRERGRFFRYDGELFTETSWVAVFLGQGIIPSGHNPIANRAPIDQLTHRLNTLREGIARTAQQLPKHEDFLRRSGANFKQ